jgi:hypothetical protein
MRLDLLIASGDYPDGQFLRLYKQEADGTWTEKTAQAGFNWEGCGAISLGDIDRDGAVDIMVGRSFMRLGQAHRDQFMGGLKTNDVGVFRNKAPSIYGNGFLNVRLNGAGGKTGSNRSGIGARVKITIGDVTQMREIRCGAGLANHQDPPEAAFGTAKATIIDRLEVRWPNAANTVQVFENVPVNSFVTVTEGSARLEIEEKF